MSSPINEKLPPRLSILSGTPEGNPSNHLGRAGSFFIHQISGRWWRKDADLHWIYHGTLPGPLKPFRLFIVDDVAPPEINHIFPLHSIFISTLDGNIYQK